MNHDYTDDEIAETHRQAAAQINSLLVAENEAERQLALKQSFHMESYTTMLVIGALGTIAGRLLDGVEWDNEPGTRLEWIADRTDELIGRRVR